MAQTVGVARVNTEGVGEALAIGVVTPPADDGVNDGLVDPRWIDQLPNGDPRHGRHVTVAAPASGKSESLAGVAARELGDDDRWPEPFEPNAGPIQPNGEHLSDPNYIKPG